MFAAAILTSCGGLNKMQEAASSVTYDVTPKVLEEHGDMVGVKIDVRYPAKYFNKKAILTATPILVYSNGETAFASKTVQGAKVEANNQVISVDGGSVSYTSAVAFNEDMMKSDLVVRVNAELKGKTMTFDDYKIAEGVIATPKLVMVDPKPIMIGDKFQRVIPDSYVAKINYVINRADVRSSELKKEDIKAFNDYLKKADTDERIDLKGVNLSAYASPDGPYDLNQKLAENRQNSANKYLSSEMKKQKIAEKSDEFVTLSYTAEDWEGFKELVQASNIQDKELILRVLSMYSDPAVREREIKNLSQAFEALKTDILPQLRRSKMAINVDLIGHSDEELTALWKNDPDSLNLEEILYTATLYDDPNTKLAIYEKAAANYPKCFRAHTNIGYVQIQLGDVKAAENAFNNAKDLMDNDIANNNLGVCALMNNEIVKAEQLFTSSMGAGSDVNYNMGIIKIMQGDYDAAAKYFGNADSYNAALVKLLQDNFDGAMKTINNVDGDFAKKYYLKAVIAANQDKDDMVMENLRMAVAKDNSLKNRAKVDMEFAKYFENDAFKNLVQ